MAEELVADWAADSAVDLVLRRVEERQREEMAILVRCGQAEEV